MLSAEWARGKRKGGRGKSPHHISPLPILLIILLVIVIADRAVSGVRFSVPFVNRFAGNVNDAIPRGHVGPDLASGRWSLPVRCGATQGRALHGAAAKACRPPGAPHVGRDCNPVPPAFSLREYSRSFADSISLMPPPARAGLRRGSGFAPFAAFCSKLFFVFDVHRSIPIPLSISIGSMV